jgi:hypothetical protein
VERSARGFLGAAEGRGGDVELRAAGVDRIGRAPGEVLGRGEHRAVRGGGPIGQMVDRVHRGLDREDGQQQR